MYKEGELGRIRKKIYQLLMRIILINIVSLAYLKFMVEGSNLGEISKRSEPFIDTLHITGLLSLWRFRQSLTIKKFD